LTVRLFGEHQFAPDDGLYATPRKEHMFRFDEAGKAVV